MTEIILEDPVFICCADLAQKHANAAEDQEAAVELRAAGAAITFPFPSLYSLIGNTSGRKTERGESPTACKSRISVDSENQGSKALVEVCAQRLAV